MLIAIAFSYCSAGMYDYALKLIRYVFKPCEQVAEFKKALVHITDHWMRIANEGKCTKKTDRFFKSKVFLSSSSRFV